MSGSDYCKCKKYNADPECFFCAAAHKSKGCIRRKMTNLVSSVWTKLLSSVAKASTKRACDKLGLATFNVNCFVNKTVKVAPY